MTLDHTHDAQLASWVDSANDPANEFPIQNLPFGVFRPDGATPPRVGIAIGDAILDVAACDDAGLLSGVDAAVRAACHADALNALCMLGRPAASTLRLAASDILRAGGTRAESARAQRDRLVHPMRACELLLPTHIGDYSDFYASVHHATNVGSMFRPENPLLPNYKWVPIGYHGRASSIVVSGAPVRRPRGQVRADPTAPPMVGPAASLDYELELGAFIGRGNALGDSVPLAQAEDHLFGLCLVNDWSARDVQSWEYQPLGPFLAKNFATTVSPWVVTLDALAPFRAPLAPRSADDPAPLPYLSDAANAARGGFDINVEAWIRTQTMHDRGVAAHRLSRGNARDLYWTFAQMLTHHTMNGCNLRPGDLIASGTISGAAPDSRGCLLELSWRGKTPLELPTGERRAFLQDGDELTLRARCERDGFRTIGFGACAGTVVGAVA